MPAKDHTVLMYKLPSNLEDQRGCIMLCYDVMSRSLLGLSWVLWSQCLEPIAGCLSRLSLCSPHASVLSTWYVPDETLRYSPPQIATLKCNSARNGTVSWMWRFTTAVMKVHIQFWMISGNVPQCCSYVQKERPFFPELYLFHTKKNNEISLLSPQMSKTFMLRKGTPHEKKKTHPHSNNLRYQSDVRHF